ncbi:YggT family protein [Brooklawnia cerclae]|uniref:YggT family protein n=1 Tax=Brooklawnia cerclae TaxID=349934 RepID=A0ABX0SGJ2_9ACTN|nr:YggT family protein [Brooklawnia cerclae]NIH57507.1 YggT family protein [Brooklawnia cerclae]
MATIGWILYTLLQVYIWLLIARMIVSWVPLLAPQWRPHGLVASLFEIVYTLTDPPIKAFRSFIPPLRLGGVSLDLAFMAVFIAVYVLQRVVLTVFF